MQSFAMKYKSFVPKMFSMKRQTTVYKTVTINWGTIIWIKSCLFEVLEHLNMPFDNGILTLNFPCN